MSNTERINISEGIILNSELNEKVLNKLQNMEILPEDNSDKRIIDYSKESERETVSNNAKKIKETEALKENKTSSVIQIPQNIRSAYIDNNINKSTLDESIYATITRDLFMIYLKIKYVINPFISKEKKYNHIRQWDLWGPLILNIILACTLVINTKEKGQITTLIFIIFWLGGFAIYLNNYFLGVKASIFQIFCLLGYCLFPLNLSAIIVTIINWNDIFRLIVVGITCFWSIYSSSDYLKVITTQDQRYLVLYPCILFYLYLSWFIFTTKN